MSIAIANMLLFGASQIGTPGPANMVLMATGARFGFRPALPFMAGVILGKQFIIWPLGLGLLAIANSQPVVFDVLKWISVAYICWLAWKIANMRLNTPRGALGPGFWSGLLVHPVNPKAWGMVITSFGVNRMHQ